MALFSPEMMKALLADGLKLEALTGEFHGPTFMDLLREAREHPTFYCPTCDQMVSIDHPLADFNPRPWRKDVFKWR